MELFREQTEARENRALLNDEDRVLRKKAHRTTVLNGREEHHRARFGKRILRPDDARAGSGGAFRILSSFNAPPFPGIGSDRIRRDAEVLQVFFGRKEHFAVAELGGNVLHGFGKPGRGREAAVGKVHRARDLKEHFEKFIGRKVGKARERIVVHGLRGGERLRSHGAAEFGGKGAQKGFAVLDHFSSPYF